MDNENETAEKNKAPGKKPWPLMIGILALTLVAIWLVPDRTPEAPPVEPLPVPLPERPRPVEPPPVQESIQSEGDYARRYIAGLRRTGGTPDEAFAEAQRLQSDGKLADAYLMYFYAARKGHGDAALALGTHADPAYYSGSDSILEAADPEQANKWYLAAAKAGNGEAEKRLAALRAKIEQDAAAGDSAAQRLMLQWK